MHQFDFLCQNFCSGHESLFRASENERENMWYALVFFVNRSIITIFLGAGYMHVQARTLRSALHGLVQHAQINQLEQHLLWQSAKTPCSVIYLHDTRSFRRREGALRYLSPGFLHGHSTRSSLVYIHTSNSLKRTATK